MSTFLRPATLALAALLATAPALAAAPSNEELYAIIQKLQSEVQALKAQLAKQQGLAQQQAESDQAQQQQIQALETTNATQVSASSKVSLGGYGELHYNNVDNDSTGAQKREFDFHRFVLYTGYEFSDSMRFVSELELEHALAGDGTTPNGSKAKPGEIELEQAYLEFDLPFEQRAKGGMFLVPVGIVNETHEPTTFYGVERSIVESTILPTTWWEGGAALSGPIASTGLSYDLAIHTGLAVPTTGGSAYRVRSGRQKIAEARGDDLAYTTRLKYTGLPGLELATTFQFQEDMTQGLDGEEVIGRLWEGHAIYGIGPVTLRGLYASWDLGGNGVKASGRERQDGWYGEAAYRAINSLGLFARYAEVDGGGLAGAITSELHQENYGLNWWPHEQIVLKADYQLQSGADNSDGFNLGLGYRF